MEQRQLHAAVRSTFSASRSTTRAYAWVPSSATSLASRSMVTNGGVYGGDADRRQRDTGSRLADRPSARTATTAFVVAVSVRATVRSTSSSAATTPQAGTER